MEIFTLLETIEEMLENRSFDIIYLDPPYKTDYIKESIEEILRLNIKKEQGIIIAETDEPKKIEQDIKDLNVQIIDQRKYGRAYLYFIR